MKQSGAKKLPVLLILLTAVSFSATAGGIEEPRSPVTPFTKKKEASEKEVGASAAYQGRAEVTTVGGNRFAGKIEFPVKKLFIPAKCSVSGRREVIEIVTVKKITIISWKKGKKSGKAWIFLPHRIRIETHDGTVVHVSEREFFRKLKFMRKKNVFSLFTVYYDYWRGGQWRFSQSRSFGGTITRGHGKTIREIRLLPVKSENSAENLIEMYLRKSMK